MKVGDSIILTEIVHETLPYTIYKGVVSKIYKSHIELSGFTKTTNPFIIIMKDGKAISPEVQFSKNKVKFNLKEFTYSWKKMNPKHTIKKLNENKIIKLIKSHWWIEFLGGTRKN